MNAESVQIPARRISFEEARADRENRKGIRQKYIDQVVNEELGDQAQLYIDRFTYDHNGQLALDYSGPFRVSNLRNPAKIKPIKDSIWLEFLALARKDTQYKSLSKLELISIFDRYFEGKLQQFIENEIKLDRKDKLNYISNSYAMSRYSDFGQGKKSRSFIWGRIFDKVEEARSKFGKDYSGEDLLKMCIHHEYLHAKDIFHGIRFGNNLVLNSSNYDKFKSEEARYFVLETEAHLNEADFAQKKFGIGHFRYRAAITSYAWHVYKTMVAPDTRIDESVYNSTERAYVRYQKDSIRKSAARHPEVARVLGLARQ